MATTATTIKTLVMRSAVRSSSSSSPLASPSGAAAAAAASPPPSAGAAASAGVPSPASPAGGAVPDKATPAAAGMTLQGSSKAAAGVGAESSPVPSSEPVLPSPAPATAVGQPGPYKVIETPEGNAGVLGFLQRCWAVIFLGLMGSCLYLVLIVGFYILFSLVVLGHRTVPLTLTALWVAQAVAPIKQFDQDPPAMKGSWLFKEMVRWFRMRVVIESKLDPAKHYLFAQFPHGTIPLGAVMSAHYVEDVVPGQRIFCLIHTGIMHLPIVRFFMGHWGALTADRENVAKARHLAGANCSIIVGGVAEIFLQNDETESLRLRKGFLREALRNGYDVVPMFHYGCTRMYKFIGSAGFWKRFSAKLPFPFFLVEGWLRVTLVPKRTPILLVVGSPLNLQALCGLKDGEAVSEPTAEMVDLAYGKFREQLEALYYRYRPEWETRDLVIVDDT